MHQYDLVTRYINATNTHDFNTLIPLISKDARYQFSDATCQGHKEIRAYFENAWHTIEKEVYSAHNIVCLHADASIQIFVYEYHYEGYLNNQFVQGKGKATNVFRHHNDAWVLILEHLNAMS